MRNLYAENNLQDKLIKDIRDSKDILLADRTKQIRGADTIQMKISTQLEAVGLLFGANETINIAIDMAPENERLSIWDFLWQFLEHDSPTPSQTWHWPDDINGDTRNVGEDFSINWVLDWAKSSDSGGRRNAYFRIKNLTGDTKYGSFAIKGYVIEPSAALEENIVEL